MGKTCSPAVRDEDVRAVDGADDDDDDAPIRSRKADQADCDTGGRLTRGGEVPDVCEDGTWRSASVWRSACARGKG